MTPEQITLMGRVREIVEKNPERHEQAVFIAAGRDDWGDFVPVNRGGLDVEELRSYALAPIPETSEKDSNVCKTTGCVAGWTAVLAAPKGSKINEMGVQLPEHRSNFESVGFSDYAAAALGINGSTATWLFSAYRSREQVLWALEWLPTQDTLHVFYPEIENAAFAAGVEDKDDEAL